MKTRVQGQAIRPRPRRLAGLACLIFLATLLARLVPVSAEGSSRLVPVERLSAPVSGHCSSPLLSPDGLQLAFERRDELRRAREVMLLSLDTRREEPARVVPEAGSSLLTQFSAATAPTSRELAWTPAGPFRSRHPYVLAGSPTDQGSRLYLAGLGRVTRRESNEGQPAWSPDGKRLVYTSAETGQGDLYLLELEKRPLTPRRLTATDAQVELYPSFSRDGSSLAFVRHSSSGDNIHLLQGMGRSHPTERAITGWASTQTRPTWSPDGQTLAYFSNHREADHFDLYVQSVASGSTPRLLLQAVQLPERLGPAWTPDGRSLVVVQESRTRLDPLVQVQVSSGRVTTLETGTINHQDPAVGMRQGQVWIFFSAQGKQGDGNDHAWSRIYGGKLGP